MVHPEANFWGSFDPRDPTVPAPLYTSQTRDQTGFTISEVAADWHKLHVMIPRRIMRPSIAASVNNCTPRSSEQTYHCRNQ